MHVGKMIHRLVEQRVIHKAKVYRELADGAKDDWTEWNMQISTF